MMLSFPVQQTNDHHTQTARRAGSWLDAPSGILHLHPSPPPDLNLASVIYHHN